MNEQSNEQHAHERLSPEQREQVAPPSAERADEQSDHHHGSQSEQQRTTVSQHQEYRVAGFWIRFLAYALDATIVSILTYLLVRSILHTFLADGAVDTVLSWISMSFFTIGILGFIYFAALTKWWSATIGKMICGLRVVHRDGEELSWLTVVLREGPSRFISTLALNLGYVWCAFHPKKQSWHDAFCDTYVVYEPHVSAKHTVRLATNRTTENT